MKKFLFPLLILGMVVVFFWQFFFKGLIPVPADTIVGLYYPYRDFYAKDYPRGIPFKNFMITDPIRQQYPWKSLVIEQEKKGQIPLWNPYTFSGGPLLGNLQSGAFYPLNFPFFVLPFSLAWGFFIFLQPLLAGIFLFFYLKNLKLDDRASLLGSISFAFGGFSISWLEWGTIIHTALWLPLLLLSIDKVLDNFDKKNVKILSLNFFKWPFILIFSAVSSFFAGHLQTFFYIFIFSFFYLLAKTFNKKDRLKIFISFVSFAVLVLLIVSIKIIPSIRFILLSGRGLDQDWHTIIGWFVPLQNIIQLIVPDFFGNPATLNYFGVWNYGEFISYIGIGALIFGVLAIFRKDKKSLFFLLSFFIAYLFALNTIIAKIPFKLSIPFISTSQPTRLIFIVDFSLSVLAALGFDYLIKTKAFKNILYVLGFISLIFAFTWSFVLFLHGNLISSDNLGVSKQNLILPTILFIVNSLLILFTQLLKNKKIKNINIRNIIYVLIIFVLLIDLFRFGWKYTPFTDKNYLYPKTKTLDFLVKNSGNYRIMSTDSRIFPPNFSIMYKLQVLDGYDPLYLQEYGELMAALERGQPNINPPFGFNRIITPQNYHSRLIDLMGVKYVLNLGEIQDVHLEKVFSEGTTIIYKNNYVLPRAFFIRTLYYAKNNQDAINLLFKNQNDLRTNAVVEDFNSAKTEWEWYKSEANIINYQENKIEILTKNKGEGFMVLTDSFYPTWHAKVDSKEVKIYRADYNFRGIIVPKGEHKVEFYITLL